jgi:hypothetical protein
MTIRPVERQLAYPDRAEHDDHEALVAIEACSGARTDVARFVRAGDDVCGVGAG